MNPQAFAVFVLASARVLPLAWVATRGALRGVPLLTLALTFVLALCVYPSAAAVAPPLPLGLLALLSLCLRELLIGLVYALALALPLFALAWSGRLSGRLLKLPGAEVALGALQQWLGLAAFFALGGHRVAIAVLARGVAERPLGAIAAPAGLAVLALGSARLLADAFASALLIALPVGAALLLGELSLALAARAGSASYAGLVLLPARAAAALLLACVAVLLVSQMLPPLLRAGLASAQHLLGGP